MPTTTLGYSLCDSSRQIYLPCLASFRMGARRTQISNPGEEWICSLCEYKLFYGEDEHERRRAIRNRKKILSRRRRAVERAAAAASGAKQRAAHAAPFRPTGLMMLRMETNWRTRWLANLLTGRLHQSRPRSLRNRSGIGINSDLEVCFLVNLWL